MRELLAHSINNVVEEKLTLRVKADTNGDVYIPTAGYSPDGTQDCNYNWMVGVDDKTPVNYSGVGTSSGKIRVGYGYVPLSVHTVIVKPAVEDYGWLRAFGYKGTDIAGTLINIISDKSYIGFALSSKYSGDYYKAYQYYGCVNLINTDEELLPDTLEVIGNYYRYYEYAGCTSLVNNAEEKILKTVKAIGDYYRAYQYQNCTSINKINMRAINWASVGNNYRYNQFIGISTDKKPADIYIEGGIEEGGDWGLEDSKVKGIYVYEGLVGDYKTKLSTITASKIKKNALWDGMKYEFIEYIAIADSNGEIRIPVGGYSTTFSQDCAYDWLVSIDGGEEEEISGTGSASYVSVGEDLEEGSEHRVIIKPKTVDWGWGRAFGFHTTGAQAYIKEIIHDSYKCFAVSRTSTGDYYKFGTFMGCTNLINSYEKLPTSVETIGDYYMKECYGACTSLVNAFWEVMHKGCTIGSDYRMSEYAGCTAMEVHGGMAGYVGGTYPTNYKDSYLGGAGDGLELYITRLENMYTTDYAGSSTYSGGTQNVATITRAGRYIFSANLNGTSSNTLFDIEIYQNSTLLYRGSAPSPGTTPIKFDLTCGVGDVIQIRKWREQRLGNMSGIKLEFSNILGINQSNIDGVYVYNDDLYNYLSNNSRSDLDANKFQIYYYNYQPRATVDITKYTKLVGSWNMPSRATTNTYSYYIGGFSTVLRGVAPFKHNSYNVRVPGERYVLNGGAVLGNIYTVKWEGESGTAVDTGSGNDVSTGTGGSINGNVKGFYTDYVGNVIYSFKYRSGDGSNLKRCGGRITLSLGGDTDNWETVISASRDGRFCWWEGKRYYSPTKWGSANVEVDSYSGSYTNIEFSEDGMTAYVASSFGTITQYDLGAPRDLNYKTSTGKTKSISGNFAFSKDFKYLYVYNGTLTVYEYQE